MVWPSSLTHAELAQAFADSYGENFKAIRTNRNSVEVWVKGKDRTHFIEDTDRYFLRRAVRLYLNWVCNNWPGPKKPLTLLNSHFADCVMREAVYLIYTPEGL